MDTVSIRQAREHLSDLVAAAERGEAVTITRRGKKVARLVPVAARAKRGLPDLTEFRAGLKMKGDPLSETVVKQRAEGRY